MDKQPGRPSRPRQAPFTPTFLLGALVVLLPVNRFPLGSQILREFGARPSNAILLILGVALFFGARRRRSPKMSRSIKAMFFVFLVLATFNVYTVLGNNSYTILGRTPLTQWFLQYLTFAFWLLGIVIADRLFRSLSVNSLVADKRFLRIVAIGALVNVLVFAIDYAVLVQTHSATGSEFLTGTLDLLRGKIDPRPSGLSSEPSVFSAWVGFIWPLLWFQPTESGASTRRRRRFYKLLALTLLGCAVMSEARTFLVIFVLQVGAYLLAFATSRGFRDVAKAVVAAGLAFGAVAMLVAVGSDTNILERMGSIVSLDENESTINRVGAVAAAIDIFEDHPYMGIGIGQYTAYYTDYVPAWALVSAEAQAYSAGDIDAKINVFNLPVRIAAEMGMLALLMFMGICLYFFYSLFNIARSSGKSFAFGLLLSYIGGVSYWLTQDLFTYTPGILALGMATALASRRMKVAPMRRALQ